MRKIQYLLTAVAGIALSGCGALTNVNDVNTLRTTGAQGGTPFTQALTNEYRIQAVSEADEEVEWDDAAFFARKGLRASRGEEVLPSDVGTAPSSSSGRYGHLGPVVPIPAGRVPELSGMREQLIRFLDYGGRDRRPLIAARAQALYDCWLEEEWEQQADDECHSEFLKIQSEFKVTQQTTSGGAPASTVGAKANTVEVFFDFDRSNISETAAQTLRDTAARTQKNHMTGIDLTGHTDASGSDAYNQALSERRAEAVKKELIKDGIPAAEITSTGVGKAGQLVPTSDGVREPQNRRTEIILK